MNINFKSNTIIVHNRNLEAPDPFLPTFDLTSQRQPLRNLPDFSSDNMTMFPMLCLYRLLFPAF